MSLLLLESAASTQDELVARVQAGEAVTGVAAGMQTAGRGRFGRPWDSPPGESLALSVLLPMPSDAKAAPFVGMALAARVAERYGIGVQWPNDVTFQGRKLAGILIEGVTIERARWLILGIGVNLSQTSFGEALAERATSLRIAFGRTPNWQEEARAIYDLAQIRPPATFAELAPLWSRFDETPGKCYRPPGGDMEIARGIDAEGRLLLARSVCGIPVAEAYFGPARGESPE